MQLFQNSGLSGAYRKRSAVITAGLSTFDERRNAFLDDRYGASHFLKPVLDRSPSAFLTNGDDASLQRLWARERGLPESSTLAEILLAQIEEHRTEVFYNVDPVTYDSTFVKKLPGSVRTAICWRAAPAAGADFSAYAMVLCNFPVIIEAWRNLGYKSEYFAPAHDPVMDQFAENEDRQIDVAFVGAYSRNHRRRAVILEALATLADRFKVVMCLDTSRLTRLAETPLGLLPAVRKYRRPRAIRQVSTGPVFGRDLYRLLSNSKVVLNGAIDMASHDRGNMRCFEALGCRALLVSDSGRYPAGMLPGQTMIEYESADQVAHVLTEALTSWTSSSQIANRGNVMVRSEYSKELQWKKFQDLL